MEGRRQLKILIGVILGFKLWGVLLILLLQSDGVALGLLLALHWPYILALAVVLGIPGLVWFRLLRGRARRAKLVYQEWNVDASPHEGPAERTKLPRPDGDGDEHGWWQE